MTIDNHPIIRRWVDKKEEEETIPEENKTRVGKNLDTIKKARNEKLKEYKKKLKEEKDDVKREKLLIKKQKLEEIDEELIHNEIIYRGEKQIKYWSRFKYAIIFLSIVFVILLYVVFWYITNNFPMIEESFTNLFCVI
jgi:hypothetical protein